MKDYHYILGVPKNATKADIKKAYRKLSKKFHPDVNDGDEFFADRFKDIQEAYEALSSGNEQPEEAPPPPPGEQKSIVIPEIVLFELSKHEIEAGEEVLVRWRVKGATGVHISLLGSVAGTGEQKIKPVVASADKQLTLTATNQAGQTTRSLKLSVRPPTATPAPAAPQKSNGLRWLAALVILCLVGIGSWALYENHAANERFEESRRRQANMDRQNQAERERMARLSREPAADYLQESDFPERPAANVPSVQSSPASRPASTKGKFTIGSTRAEVIGVQGTPSSVMQYGISETLSYGLSSVDLKNGRVTGYSNLSNNLKVTAKETDSSSSKKSFFLGATRADVVSVQGTPSSVMQYGDSETLSYGLSSVDLKNGRVTGYSNLSNNLRVVASLSGVKSGNTRFSIGATRAEVFSIQGTPSGIMRYGNSETFSYGLSSVDLKGGRVTGYSDLANNLKVN